MNEEGVARSDEGRIDLPDWWHPGGIPELIDHFRELYGPPSDLAQAVFAGQIDRVRALIDSGADVNASDRVGQTPLHIAVQNRRGEMIQLLVRAGANINCPFAGLPKGTTPLHLALDSEAEEAFTRNACSGDTSPPPSDITRLLLELGADVNVRDEEGHTPLGLALMLGHSEAARILREHGAVE